MTPFRRFSRAELRVHEELLHLKADLGVFIGVEHGAMRGFRRAEGFTGETLFLVFIEEYVIWHQYLSSVSKTLMFGCRYVFLHERIYLADHIRYIEGNAVAEYVGNMIIEDARREHVKGELSVVVFDGVSRVAAYPWKRMTMSASCESISVIFPFPSSPQLAPTIAFIIWIKSPFS